MGPTPSSTGPTSQSGFPADLPSHASNSQNAGTDGSPAASAPAVSGEQSQPGRARFQESHLRTARIRDLGLKIEGTRLEPILKEFHQELATVGIRRLQPRFYLSTEWGVPFGSISIALPFYLAKPELEQIQAEEVGHIEGVSRADILRYLRHEMGHVVNYAYKLFESEEWVKMFGSITQPYIDDYRPQPFSKRYVRHLPGWYAQKHPDEDWAETFAVWMTPALDWRKTYAAWPSALAKLNYCDRVMTELRDREPVVRIEDLDEDVGQLTDTLQEFYNRAPSGAADLPPGVEGALTAIFDDVAASGSATDGAATGDRSKPAGALIRKMERELVANIYRWTGHFPERTRPLIRYLAERADELKQVYPANRENDVSLAITTLVTALAMNYVHRGTYLP